MEKLSDVSAMDHYAAVNNELMRFAEAALWIDLEGVVLSQVSKREKDDRQVISLICGIESKQG